MYHTGDYVYLADVPGHVLCRVAAAEDVTLELEPLDGPWPQGTRLIRLDRAVNPADVRQLWRSGTAPHAARLRSAGRPRERRTAKRGAAA